MNFFILFLMSIITTATMEVSSPSFKPNEYIPAKYTCEGENINPSITIKNIPEQAKSLALIMDDPDAPNGTFDHWIIWNISPGPEIGERSAPGTQGRNGRGNNSYTGPCPPSGTHHYHFKVYALDSKLELQGGADKAMLEKSMRGHILASGELIGLYKKAK